jgi:hypothetical protein
MKTQELKIAAEMFKKSYAAKMGGTQTVVMPNGERHSFDDREWYSGRGAKYNASINHHTIGDVVVTNEEYSAAVEKELARLERVKENQMLQSEKSKRQQLAKENGVYDLVEVGGLTFIDLTDEEEHSQTFDAERLANTLKVNAAELVDIGGMGKTYVTVKSLDGKVYQLFHAALSCNPLRISVSEIR